MKSAREQELEEALDALVTTARPAFPRTPYRVALEHAERMLREREMSAPESQWADEARRLLHSQWFSDTDYEEFSTAVLGPNENPAGLVWRGVWWPAGKTFTIDLNFIRARLAAIEKSLEHAAKKKC